MAKYKLAWKNEFSKKATIDGLMNQLDEIKKENNMDSNQVYYSKNGNATRGCSLEIIKEYDKNPNLKKGDKFSTKYTTEKYCEKLNITTTDFNTWQGYYLIKDIQDFETYITYHCSKENQNIQMGESQDGTPDNNPEGEETMSNNEYKHPLNQILYGPPGTGKTYNTVIRAMEIIGISADKPKEITLTDDEYKRLSDKVSRKISLLDDKEIEENKEKNKYTTEEYKALKILFDQAKENHQIEFVTFHQSYSYEDFVEGIRPDLKSEDLKYIEHKGIFKEIVNRAKEKETDNFDEAYNKLIEKIQEYCADNSKICFDELKTNGGKQFGINLNSNGNLNLYTGKNLTQQGSLKKERLHNLSDWKYYAKPILEYMKQECNYSVSKSENTNKLYVLIIDEINRGNISKIFGELITLIEEDKREDVRVTNKDKIEYNTIEVTLPYTKEKFTVPNNLYIIGTMNTADKSLALLDVALRRRFEFVPMYPQYDFTDKEMPLKDFLQQLNTNISPEGKSADYLIGHAYFLGKKKEELKNILNKKVIPLLMEYCNNDKVRVKNILEKPIQGYNLTFKKNTLYLEVTKAEKLNNTLGDGQQGQHTDEDEKQEKN